MKRVLERCDGCVRDRELVEGARLHCGPSCKVGRPPVINGQLPDDLMTRSSSAIVRNVNSCGRTNDKNDSTSGLRRWKIQVVSTELAEASDAYVLME